MSEAAFRAIGEPHRRDILRLLRDGPRPAGEIAERFDMTKPSLSKHLRILEQAGLVTSEKRGQFVHYRLADDNLLATLHDFLTAFCPVGRPLKKESAALAKGRRKPAA